jgi:hypothetical protein
MWDDDGDSDGDDGCLTLITAALHTYMQGGRDACMHASVQACQPACLPVQSNPVQRSV